MKYHNVCFGINLLKMNSIYVRNNWFSDSIKGEKCAYTYKYIKLGFFQSYC